MLDHPLAFSDTRALPSSLGKLLSLSARIPMYGSVTAAPFFYKLTTTPTPIIYPHHRDLSYYLFIYLDFYFST